MTYDTLEKLVNDSLEMQVNSLGDIPETLKKAMLYSLEAGGKRLRPVLLLAACDFAGGGHASGRRDGQSGGAAGRYRVSFARLCQL